MGEVEEKAAEEWQEKIKSIDLYENPSILYV